MDLREIEHAKMSRLLEAEEIEYFVSCANKSLLSDKQIVDFLSCLNKYGISSEEVFLFSKAIAKTGEMLNIDKSVPGSVDKQSIGAVPDYVSYILLGLLPALDVPIVKIVNEDSYNNLSFSLSLNVPKTRESALRKFKECNVYLQANTNICPVSKKIIEACKRYHRNLPFVVASIYLAEKIAVGATLAIFDVKNGEGGLVEGDAISIVNYLVEAGKLANIKVVAVETDLSYPISNFVGFGLELKEVVDTLSGAKEHSKSSLMILSKEIISCILLAQNRASTRTEAAEMILEAIESGRAYKEFLNVVKTYGGKLDLPKIDMLETAVSYIISKSDGYVYDIKIGKIYEDAKYIVGNKEDLSAGVELLVAEGDKVVKGQKLARVYYNYSNKRYFEKYDSISECFQISSTKPKMNNLFYKVVL